jgi:hypothetical protein
VPVSASGLTDVGAADPQPTMVSRRLDQGVQQLPVGGLDGGLGGKRGAGLPDALGELVTHTLEGTEVEKTRAGARGDDPVGDVEAAEPIEGQARQFELEATDLPAQLDPGAALVIRMRAGRGPFPLQQTAGRENIPHRIVCNSGLVASSVWVKT